ncbi:MAG TPA: ABC transporter permease [Cyclobacteriaceae bacterium]|nr:ABC transporter permease [Cyclobacteriaceae bacterium]
MIEPPKIASRILEKFCPPQLYEGIEGDLTEQFYADVEIHGEKIARRKFVWNVVRFFRFEILLRNRFVLKLINIIMVGNYFKVAVRNIQKRKLYSFINAFGLSIGIAFCMLIWLFIQDELSFDQFHENKKDIYRIEAITYNYWDPKLKDEERTGRDAWLQLGLSKAIKEECPEVVRGARFSGGGAIFTYKDKVFSERLTYTDKDFFSMFSFKLLQGSAEKVFTDRYELVLTPEIVEKYFGDADPIGETMSLNFGQKEIPFTVTGVIEAPPANSSLVFKILIPQENRGSYERQMTSWGNFNTPSFVQLRSDADTALFKRNLAAMADKHVGPTLAKWKKEGNVPDNINLLVYTFSPLTNIHLMKEIGWEKVSDKQYSYILGGIALLILLIASINYISLALTTSAARRTEVGIRKVVGAIRRQLFYQFGFESIVLAVISLMVGIVLVLLFLPSFNTFTNKGIALKDVNWVQFLSVGVGLALLVGALAGSYPSIFLARFKPVAVLKGRFTTKMQAGFTKPLVVIQFGMSAFLIISSVIMYRQMKFIATKDLGFNQHAVINVPHHVGWTNEAERVFLTFRSELEKIPAIESVAGISQPFAEGYNVYGFKVNDVNHSAYVYAVDPAFIPTMGMTMTYGRNFDPAVQTDSMGVVVNEALVKDLAFNDLSDAYVNWKEDSTSRGFKVIGVVKDFHFGSLESAIKPMFFTLDRKDGGHLIASYIRIAATDMPATIQQIESAWRRLFPDKPFEYKFVDEMISEQYKRYKSRMNLVGVSTVFAILISCLGLFGLAGINAVNRTKEIGIRKVMGADLKSIFILLNRQYVWLSLIAFALAIPFSWYVMDLWLKGFEFRIPMGWELFALSMVAGLLVALTTVSYHAVRACLVNPAETLKYE